MKKPVYLTIVLVIVGVLSSCATIMQSQRLSNVDSWDVVPEDHILLVGSINHEFATSGWTFVWPEGDISILNYSTNFEEIAPPSFENYRQARWEEMFLLGALRSSQLLLYRPALTGDRRDAVGVLRITIEMPSLIVDVPANARALYIGEVLYTPVEGSPNLADVSVEDNYDEVAAEFYAIMGDEVPLLRALTRAFSVEEDNALQAYIEENYQ